MLVAKGSSLATRALQQSSFGCLEDSTTHDGCKELEGALHPLLHLSIVGVGEDIFLGVALFPFLYNSRYLIWAWVWQKRGFSANFAAGKLVL